MMCIVDINAARPYQTAMPVGKKTGQVMKMPGKPAGIPSAMPGESHPSIEEETPISCRSCGHTVTSVENTISVSGSHRHICTNPAGITFEIGCFSSAPGCGVYGESTMEFTWFDGYGWSFAMCASCGTHLGWFYEGSDNSFFGLILDRLAGMPPIH